MHSSRLVLRNISTTLAAQLVSWVVALVVTLYVPRYLGSAGYGELTLAGSFAAIFGLILSVVNGIVVLREVSRQHDSLARFVCTSIVVRCALWIIALALGTSFCLVFGGRLHYTPELQELFLLSLLLLGQATVNDILSSALRGLEEIPLQNAAALAEKLVSSALMIFMVVRGMPLSWIISTGFISMAVSFAIYLKALRPYFTGWIWPDWSGVKSLAASSLPFLTTGIFVSIYGQCDAQLLSRLSTLTAIGWYGLAKKLFGTCLVVPSTISNAMLPTLSRLYHEDRPLFDIMIRKFVGYMFLLVVPFAATLILAPGPLIHLLYPASFDGAIPVMVALGFAITLWFLSQAAATGLIASDRQDVLSRATGVAALVCVPVCAAGIWLTQHFYSNGAVGAVIADAIVEIYLVTLYLKALPLSCVGWRQMLVLLKGLVAAVPMVAPLYFIHNGHWALAAMLPGLAAYLPLAYVLGCLEPEDIQVFKNALGRRFNLKMTLPDEGAGNTGFNPTLDEGYAEHVAFVADQQLGMLAQVEGEKLGSLAEPDFVAKDT